MIADRILPILFDKIAFSHDAPQIRYTNIVIVHDFHPFEIGEVFPFAILDLPNGKFIAVDYQGRVLKEAFVRMDVCNENDHFRHKAHPSIKIQYFEAFKVPTQSTNIILPG